MMRRFASALLCLVSLAAPGRAGATATGPEESIAAALMGHGFESVAVSRGGDRVRVQFEDRIYRYEMVGVGVAALLSSARLDSAAILEIVPVSRGVPFMTLSARSADWRRFLEGRVTAAEFRQRLAIDTSRPGPAGNGAGGGKGAGTRAMAPSQWKVDLALRPLADIQIGIADQPFQTAFWLAPEATMSPLRGVLVTAQGNIEVRNEFSSSQYSRTVQPGRNTVTVAGWLPGSCLGTASLGYFPGDRYGLAWEVGRLLGDGSLEVRLAADYSGFLKFSRHVVEYSKLSAWSGVGSLIYRTPRYDVDVIATAGRYMYGDRGGRLDIIRHFGEAQFGFFGIKTDRASVGGLRFDIPLPLRRQAPPSRIRLTTVPSFPFEYRENLSFAGMRVRLFDTLDRFRGWLYPTYVRNNLEDLRRARSYVGSEGS